jgi:hypothetical protein
MTQEKDKRTNNRLCMLVALIDIFVIKLLSYDLKDPMTSIGKLNEVE